MLAKASGTDFDTDWVDAPTGGGGDIAAQLRSTDANAFYASGSYPTRASVTTDTLRRVVWVGPVPPTVGGSYAIVDFDIWQNTA